MKKRLNFIDICIIIFIILAIVFAVSYFSVGKKSLSIGEKKDVYYTVEIKSMPYDIGDHIAIGDSVRNSMKGYDIGVVSDIDIKKNSEIREDTINGKFIQTSFPDRCDVYLTIKATPSISEDGTVTVNSDEIKIGKMMYLRSKKYALSGYIVDMKLTEVSK